MGTFVFCGLFVVFAFFEASVRPYAVAVLLAQQEGDTGSASALINFTRTFTGVIGMFAVMAPVFSGYVNAVGWLMAGGMLMAIIAWVALLRSSMPLSGVKGGRGGDLHALSRALVGFNPARGLTCAFSGFGRA